MSVMVPLAQGDLLDYAPGGGDGIEEGMRRFRDKPSSDWRAEFTRYCLGRNLSSDTVVTYLWGLKVLNEHTGKDPWEIGATDLRVFMEESPRPPRTKNQILSAARAGHKWAAAMGYCDLNGVLAVQGPKLPKRKRKPPVSPETARAFLVSARTPHEVRVVYFGLYAGTRVGESAAMTPDHLKRDRFRFIGKGDVERDVPIHPELEKVLPLIFQGQPSRDTLIETMKRLRDRLGAVDTMGKPATSHSLRRTCGTTMYAKGASWEVADTVLGHALPGAGESYIEIGFDRLSEAVGLIDFYSDLPVQMALF